MNENAALLQWLRFHGQAPGANHEWSPNDAANWCKKCVPFGGPSPYVFDRGAHLFFVDEIVLPWES